VHLFLSHLAADFDVPVFRLRNRERRPYVRQRQTSKLPCLLGGRNNLFDMIGLPYDLTTQSPVEFTTVVYYRCQFGPFLTTGVLNAELDL